MFDDEVSTPLSLSSGSKYYKVAKFPTRNIRTPIVLVYGGSDSLVDIDVMLRELPRHTVVRGVGKYEHLDFLWASDVDEMVFPHVLEALGEGVAVAGKGVGNGFRLAQYSEIEQGTVPLRLGESASTLAAANAGAIVSRAAGAVPAVVGPPALQTNGVEKVFNAAGYEADAYANLTGTTEHLDESDLEDEEGENGVERLALTPEPGGRRVRIEALVNGDSR